MPSIEQLKLNLLKDKKFLYAAIAVISIALGFVFYYLATKKPSEINPPANNNQQKINQQLKELDDLRAKDNAKNLSQEDIKQQAKDLDTLRQEQDPNPPTKEDIQKQLDELDKLRQGK